MASFNKTIITNNGRSLIAKVLSGDQIKFTKMVSSSRDYTSADLSQLTDLSNVEQTILISSIKKTSDSAVKITGIFSNKDLKTGYKFKTVGLYAIDPDLGEILYSVTTASSVDDMPANTGIGLSSITIGLVTEVSNSNNASLEVSDLATVSVLDFNEFKDNVNSQLNENAIYVDRFYIEGENDDSAMFQRAVDNVENMGTVLLTKGKTYNINSIVEINKSIFISGNNSNINVNFNSCDTEVFKISSDNVTIEKINFIGIGELNELNYRAFIRSISSNTIVSNCRFKNGMQGVHFSTSQCKNCVIENCYVENCLGSGILCFGSIGISVLKNTVIGCGDGAISLFNSSNCIVEGNKVINSDQMITVDAGANNNIVNANTVIGNKDGTDMKSGYYGIDVKNNSNCNIISNNTVTGVIIGIACRYGDSSNQSSCYGNIINNNNINEISGKGLTVNSFGILIQAQIGLQVKGNTISRCNGINIYACSSGSYNKELSISDNIIELHNLNIGTSQYLAIDKQAIKISGYLYVSVLRNIIKNAPEQSTQYCIEIDSCSFIDIGENIIGCLTYRFLNINGNTCGMIRNNFIESTKANCMFIYSKSDDELFIEGNKIKGQIGYFILTDSNASFIQASNNSFCSNQLDAILFNNNTSISFNNRNTGTGINGGQLRINNELLEMWNKTNLAYKVVGAQS